MRILPVIAAVTAAFLVVACSSPTPPPGVTVVSNFDAQRFLGTWYEIARMHHQFERGLEKVTVSYSAMDDGGIRVINRGYNPDRQMWQQSVGQAYFTGASNRAAMKVSFIYHSTAGITSLRWTESTAMRWCVVGSQLSVAPLPHANDLDGNETADAGHSDPARV